VLGYIFPFSMKDKISPPSVVGAAGLITNNGSRGFAVGAQLYLKEIAIICAPVTSFVAVSGCFRFPSPTPEFKAWSAFLGVNGLS
jgi:hypothetical protein